MHENTWKVFDFSFNEFGGHLWQSVMSNLQKFFLSAQPWCVKYIRYLE